MSSLPETASAATDVAGVASKNDANFEISVRKPLPSAIYIVLGLVVLGLGTFAYLKFLQPMFAGADTNLVAQYAGLSPEAQKHTFQDPEKIQVIFDAPDKGMLAVKVYPDGCVNVQRRNRGQNQAVLEHWIEPKSVETEQAPGDVGGGGGTSASRLRGPSNDPQPGAMMMLASFKASAEPPSQGPCLNPHPGPFQSQNGEQRGCWIAIWRKWPEGCQHYQWFNTCKGYWDSDQTGAPRLHWTYCAQH